MTPTLDNAKSRRRRAKASEGAILPPVHVDTNDGSSPAVSPEAIAPPLLAPSQKAPRPGSHLAGLVALMQRPEGATVAAMVAATGWQRHSVRGALAGALKKTYGLTIASEAAEGGRVYRIPTGEAAA